MTPPKDTFVKSLVALCSLAHLYKVSRGGSDQTGCGATLNTKADIFSSWGTLGVNSDVILRKNLSQLYHVLQFKQSRF
ncbi:unnamed protein product, partial [Ixodes pacificus]